MKKKRLNARKETHLKKKKNDDEHILLQPRPSDEIRNSQFERGNQSQRLSGSRTTIGCIAKRRKYTQGG